MVIITLLITRSYFRPDQASKVGKKYIDWLKDNPPDKIIAKNLCIAVLSTEDGNIMVIGISEIGKGKEKEALEAQTKTGLFLAKEVEGYRYKNEVVLSFTEAYKIIGMDAPDV